MHRSGTSLVASLLAGCGVYLGPEAELKKPAPDNLAGYWENSDFVTLNQDLIAEFGGRWNAPPDFSPGWEATIAVDPFLERARQLVGHFDQPNWGWKDPRTAFTLPFWQQLLPDLRVIICVRHPLEVARSLFVRGSEPVPNQFELWLAHYRRLLAAAKPEQRLVTHYQSYFCDGHAELRRLLVWLGVDATDEQVADVCQRISRDFRHHKFEANQSLAIPDEVLSLYLQLCAEAGPVYQQSRAQEVADVDWSGATSNEVKALASELQRVREAHNEIVNSRSFRLVSFFWRWRRGKTSD